MKKTKNIIQFTPYANPHIGGVEDVSDGIYGKWTYGKSSLMSGCLGQENIVYDNEVEKNKNNKGLNNKIIFPDFDIIDNFPVPKIWTKLFWKQWGKLGKSIDTREKTVVITHTRFFLSSLMGGIFARRNKLKWIHIEHGSDYVKLSSPLISKISYFYDRIIGKWIFKKADTVLCISIASRDFVQKEFGREADIWYRGRDITEVKNKTSPERVFLYVGRLVDLKGVDVLLRAYALLKTEIPLKIIGDGPERVHLEKISQELGIFKKVEFLGQYSSDSVIEYLRDNTCILVNPSYQEGMPTTVIEGLMTKNIVVASDVGGTAEISEQADLLLSPAGSVEKLSEKLIFAEAEYDKIIGKSYDEVRGKFSWETSIESLYNHL